MLPLWLLVYVGDRKNKKKIRQINQLVFCARSVTTFPKFSQIKCAVSIELIEMCGRSQETCDMRNTPSGVRVCVFVSEIISFPCVHFSSANTLVSPNWWAVFPRRNRNSFGTFVERCPKSHNFYFCFWRVRIHLNYVSICALRTPKAKWRSVLWQQKSKKKVLDEACKSRDADWSIGQYLRRQKVAHIELVIHSVIINDTESKVFAKHCIVCYCFHGADVPHCVHLYFCTC